MIRHYVLRGHEPVQASLLEWAAFFENVDNRRVAEAYVGEWHRKPSLVSAVFLGIDHDFLGDGPPILFQTIVFGGPLHGENDGVRHVGGSGSRPQAHGSS